MAVALDAEYLRLMQDSLERLKLALADRYRLEREVGAGGMAKVYLAHDLRHDREVAIKVLRPDLAAALGGERFLREIRIAAQLRHPHILGLIDSGEADGVLYYVMPFVEGESLRDRLAREGALPVTDAVRILREVADALATAHARGIVHRDVKPENVMLEGRHALVMDFGVAKAVSAAGGAQGVTTAGVALGTPTYMAPEQVTGESGIDQRADLYALGILGYEMLTGRPPFTGTTVQMIFAAQMTETPVPLTKHRPAVPPALNALVMRCLEKRPADRPQTADETLHALDAIVTPSGGTELAPSSRAQRSSGRSWSRRSTRVAAAALLVVLGGTIFAVWRGVPRGTALAKSIAVLPFANLSGAKENEFFSEGMTEEITDALGKVPGLRVAARGSAKAAADKESDPRRVGQALGVGSVLAGSIQRVGDRVRITAQLVDATNGFQLWNGKYENELKDIFQVQDTIAKAIVSALSIRLAGGAATFIVRVATQSPEAHTLYLQGLYLWNRRTAATVRQAISFFQQATAKDPRYAQAYAGVAMGYAVLPAYADLLAADALAKAKEAASRALALDSTVVEAYAVIGFVDMSTWQNAGAERAFRRAIELDSTFATAHHWYALYLAHLARNDEAVSEIRRAHDLDPQSRIIGTQVGDVLYGAHRNAEAERALRRALEFDPSFAWSYRSLAMVLVAQDKYDDAVAAAQRSIELSGERQSFTVALLAHAYALGGHTAEARALLQELVARSAHGPVSGTGMALIYDALGDRERALQWLGRAVAEFDWPVRNWSTGPLLAHLRADPRGAALLATTETMNDTLERRE